MTKNRTVRKRGLIYYRTLGCKVNAYETASIQHRFEKEGFEVTSDPLAADVYVINTCTVTAEADRKTRQMIRRARKLAPQAIIAAMGCQIQSDPENNDADIVVGTQNRHDLVYRVIEAFDRNKIQEGVPDLSFDRNFCHYDDGDPVLAQEGARAYIKIQDGCDRFCSYCIIPYMRGQSRSRPISSILDEARALSDNGYNEVVLTGINICAYGKDLKTDEDLSVVVDEIAQVEGIQRIRLGSVEPIYLSDIIIKKLSLTKKLAPHFHLSLQSGSDRILKAMNRQYDTKFFLHVVNQIKSFFSEYALTTDVIVGFPGETDADHIESLAFCQKVAFSKIHVFPFSPRQGTQAAELKGRPGKDIVKIRCEAFQDLSDRLFEQWAYQRKGEVLHVLIETKNEDGSFLGYSEDYFRVRVNMAEEKDVGSIVPVRIGGMIENELTGNRINN